MSNITWAELSAYQKASLKSAANAGRVHPDETWGVNYSAFREMEMYGLLEKREGWYYPTPAGLVVWQQRDGAQSEHVPNPPLAKFIPTDIYAGGIQAADVRARIMERAITALWQPAVEDTQPDLDAALEAFRGAVAALELSANFDADGGVLMTERMVDVLEAGVAMLRARGVTQGAFGDAMTRRLMHTANG